MFILYSILAILLSLLLVIGLHEIGHALLAHFFKVKIKRISIGFGKPLLIWQGRHGWEWVWSLWPLGGYVHLLNSRIESESVAPDQMCYCFDKKPVWIRITILVAGAAANFMIAWIAFVFMFMLGYQQNAPVVAAVSSPSIAADAGLRAGDRLLSIAGKPVSSWRDAGMMLIRKIGQKNVSVFVEGLSREPRQVNFDLQLWRYKRGNNALLEGIGIRPALVKEHAVGVSFIPATQQAFWQVINLLVFFMISLKQLVSGIVPFAVLLGPLGLFSEMITSFNQGFVAFLYFIASLSLAIGLVNLFPIPGLDGGSILYALVEKIRGKPISIALEILLYRLAYIVFAVFFIQLLLNDLQHYIN